MLIVLIVIQVTGVLLDTRINTQRAGIGLLDSQVIGFKLAINLTLLLSIGTFNPNALHIRATNDVVPVRVGTTVVLLRQGEEGVMAHGFREAARHLIPEVTSFIRQRLELLLEVLERLGEAVGSLLGRGEDLLEGRSRSGRPNQHRSWEKSHCDCDELRGRL